MTKVSAGRWRSASLVALVLWLGMFAGCGPKGPKTYPIKGKLVIGNAENLKRLAGQGIEFQSTIEPDTRAFGQIQADGTFTVTTYRLGVTVPGAIEGPHKARLQISVGEDEDDTKARKKWPVERKFTRFETSGWEITVPAAGEVVLKLP